MEKFRQEKSLILYKRQEQMRPIILMQPFSLIKSTYLFLKHYFIPQSPTAVVYRQEVLLSEKVIFFSSNLSEMFALILFYRYCPIMVYNTFISISVIDRKREKLLLENLPPGVETCFSNFKKPMSSFRDISDNCIT